MSLSNRDNQISQDHIDRGGPIPPKYKLALFGDSSEAELIWQGKTAA